MDLLQALVLALLQGLTEFLPISSSAHLILLPRLLGWSDQGLAFDVAVHVGTLAAVIWYFRCDIRALSSSLFAAVFLGRASDDTYLARAILVATLPILLTGIVVYWLLADLLRNPLLIAATTLLFGLLLWWADRSGARDVDESSLTTSRAFVIGCAQALALIPGVSRSGVTITAGLALGLTRQASARFSFLLSIPVITAAGLLSFLDLVRNPHEASWGVIALGTVVSGVTAYLCIYGLLALIERIGVMPFVIYRILLALLLLVVFT
jgi:undecaprenyl-diphosphatase